MSLLEYIPYPECLPATLFGLFAIVATIILDIKICKFKEQRNSDRKHREKNHLKTGAPQIKLSAEGDNFKETEHLIESEEEVNPKKLPEELLEKHILYVCMKCNYRKGDCSKVVNCKLESNQNMPIEVDMEELIAPQLKQTDVAIEDTAKVAVKSGAVLYHRIKQAHEGENSPTKKFGKKFEIRQTRCLSMCDNGNCIAYHGPATKYQYQFIDLDHNKPEVVEDILKFSKIYIESEDGVTKSKTRPHSLRKTLSARIPPKDHFSTYE